MHPVIFFFFQKKWFNHSSERFFEMKWNFSTLHPLYLILYFFHLLALLMTAYKRRYIKSQALVLCRYFLNIYLKVNIKISSPLRTSVFSSLRWFRKESRTWWSDLLVSFRTVFLCRIKVNILRKIHFKNFIGRRLDFVTLVWKVKTEGNCSNHLVVFSIYTWKTGSRSC